MKSFKNKTNNKPKQPTNQTKNKKKWRLQKGETRSGKGASLSLAGDRL